MAPSDNRGRPNMEPTPPRSTMDAAGTLLAIGKELNGDQEGQAQSQSTTAPSPRLEAAHIEYANALAKAHDALPDHHEKFLLKQLSPYDQVLPAAAASQIEHYIR